MLNIAGDESTVAGDLNCAIDAFIDRGSASIRLAKNGFSDGEIDVVQVIYPITDEIAIAHSINQSDLESAQEIARGKIMYPVDYFEGCKTTGDDVAIFSCLWDWGNGCGDTTLTCEE